MKSKLRTIVALTLLAGAGFSMTAQARDDRLHFPVADAMAAAGGKLDGSVKFFWGSQGYPKGGKEMGAYTSNKKTNFFNKSDKEACDWAWLSAMIALQDRAKREGGNAVVGIHSVYRNAEFTSETEYECGAGNVTGGVALRGTVVKLP